MAIINSNVSACGLVEKYIGTAYDNVKNVSDNMEHILNVDGCIDDGTCQEIIDLGPNIILAAGLINYMGIWDSVTTYVLGESVYHEGSFWISNGENLNSEPINGNLDWAPYSVEVFMDTLSDLHVRGEGQLGDSWATLGVFEKGDQGAGQWYWDADLDKAGANLGTIMDPSVALTIAAQGGGIGTGCWVRAYSGAINARWFGAKGDGVTDDTVALQKAIDMLKAKTAASMFTPAGVYNFSVLTFYDPAHILAERGNFHFYGEARESSKNPEYSATIFNCTATAGDCFIVNSVDRDNPYNSAMQAITMENFSVFGNTSGDLVKVDIAIKNSLFQNITIQNIGTGVGLRIWSCYTSLFKNILLEGDSDAGATLYKGIGLYVDTERGTGSVLNLEEITAQWFDTGIYWGPSIENNAAGGADRGVINGLISQYNNQNCHFGSGATIKINSFYVEAATGVCINLGVEAKVYITNAKLTVNSKETMLFQMANRSGSTFPHFQAAKLVISDSSLTVAASHDETIPDFAFINVPTAITPGTDDPWPSISVTNCEIFNRDDRQFVDLPDDYKGILHMSHNSFQGFSQLNQRVCNHPEFIAASSDIPFMLVTYKGILDLSARTSIPPQVQINTQTEDGTLLLPNSLAMSDSNKGMAVYKAQSAGILTIDPGLRGATGINEIHYAGKVYTNAAPLVIAAGDFGSLIMIPVLVATSTVHWICVGSTFEVAAVP